MAFSWALKITYTVFLVLGGAYLVGSFKLPLGTAKIPGAGLFPFVVGITLVALSSSLLFLSFRAKEIPKEDAFPTGKDRQRVVAVALTLLFFAVFLSSLGFGVCSTVMMVTVLKLFGLRSWIKAIFISLVTIAIFYYLFVILLDIPLPGGILFP